MPAGVGTRALRGVSFAAALATVTEFVERPRAALRDLWIRATHSLDLVRASDDRDHRG